MTTHQRNRFHIAALTAALFAFTALLAGCASIEHVRLYREAREDFSSAAAADNLATLHAVFPDLSQLNEAGAALARNVPGTGSPSLVNVAGVRQSYDRWTEVSSLLTALNARAQDDLKRDQLYGSSKTLELIARTQRDLYGHVLGITAKEDLTDALEPLTVPLAEASALLADKDVKLFPRDDYLLRALRAESRYKIAYLNAVRDAATGELTPERVGRITDEMSTAEEELKTAADASSPHVLQQAALSRAVMLISATFLARTRGGLPANLPLDAADPRLKPFTRLSDRLAHFHDQATRAGTSENKLFASLVGKPNPTESDLTAAGLVKLRQ